MGSNRAQVAAIQPTKAGQPLGVLAKYRAACRRLLCERPIAVLSVLFVAAIAVIIWHTDRQQSILVKAQALQSAERLANSLTEFRTIYTSEVVERVRQQGITVTHDYEHKEGAIPLPATLSMMLGNQIGTREPGAQTRLYSAFPFPWRRADGGLTDAFAEDAWELLTKKPDTPFYRFEGIGGVPVLRYATADLMRSACVDCHNSHPDSPKTDWKVGDVRGILEVIAPLAVPLAVSHSGLLDTTLLMLLMTLGGLLVTGVVLGQLRRAVADAHDLTKQTEEANEGLEKEVAERRAVEQTLRKSEGRLSGILNISHDAIISTDGKQRIIMFNHGAEKTFGYTAQEVLGQPLEILVPEFVRERHHALVAEFAASPIVSQLMSERSEIAALRKDGSEFPVMASISKLVRDDQHIFTVTLRDITERRQAEVALREAHDSLELRVRERTAELETENAQRKRAEGALRESKERFRTVVNNSPTKIHIKDTDGRYILVNKVAEKLFGVTEDEARGKTAHEIFPDKQADDFDAHDQAVLETGQTIAEEEQWALDDGVHTYLTVKFPIRDGKGEIAAIGAIGTDITERRCPYLC